MKGLVPITAEEMANLIRETRGSGEPLPIAFGRGGVALESEKAEWAVPLLAAWRGQTFTDGAGI